MSITYNSQEAKLEKKPTTYQGFTYDTETNGGCVNKFEEVSKLILDVSNDVEELGNKYTSLQAKYDKFTDFNDKMNSNKNSLRNSVDNIKKGFDSIIQNLNKQVTALQANDASLMTDLESIAKLISNSKDQDKTISDSRNKNDGSSSSSGKSDEDKAKAVDDVINGKYGSGDERKEALRKAGFDPDEIQKMVNNKLNGGGSSSSGDSSQTERPEEPKDTGNNNESGYRTGTSGVPAVDEHGLIVRTKSQAGQDVINKLYHDIDSTKPASVGSVRAQGTHSAELDAMIDNLSAEECAWVLSRIENEGFGQSGAGYSTATPESHQAFIEQQLYGRFGGDIHNLLKVWGTLSYGGY
jgi:hypothetical protein